MRNIRMLGWATGLLVSSSWLLLQTAEASQKKALISMEAFERRNERVERFVNEGKDALVKSDVAAAYKAFFKAYRFDRRSPEANFYLAVTRVLLWPMRHLEDLKALGFSGPRGGIPHLSDINPLRFMAMPPKVVMIPATFSRGAHIQQFLAKDLLVELQKDQMSLARVPAGFRSFLPVRNPLTAAASIEIDDADVSLCRAAVSLALAQVHLSQVYNLDVDTNDLARRITQHHVRVPGEFLRENPDALRLQDVGQAHQAKQALIAAIDHYLAADASMRAETDDQTNDLFAFSRLPDDLRKQDAFRKALVQLRTSLTGLSDAAWTLTLDQVLHLGDFFDRPVDLRSLETGQGVQEALLSHVLYQTQRALANLHKAPQAFSEHVDPATFGIPSRRAVEVDYGDLLALQAGLESLNTAVDILASYHVDANLPDVASAAALKTLDMKRDLLGPHPELLRLQDHNRLAEAKVEGQHALQDALSADAYVRLSDDTDQTDDLFRLEGRLAAEEARWRPAVEQLFQSLQTSINPHLNRVGDEFRVNLNPFFDQPTDPRELLPSFDRLRPRVGTLPDPTLGGIVPDFTQDDWGKRR